MKQIIQRNLPLNVKYILTDKKYIPLEVSIGAYCCDNCGKLIANIATVKNDLGNSYNIGFDCLETILINNSLLSTNDVKEYQRIKSMIPKVLRFSKTIKETAILNRENNLTLTGLKFEKQTYLSEFYTFYWLFDRAKPYNSYVKLKDMDFDFLLTTLKNIFPKLEIQTT
jgi:hypothetical protein